MIITFEDESKHVLEYLTTGSETIFITTVNE